MKKLAFITAAVMGLSLCGCADSSDSSGADVLHGLFSQGSSESSSAEAPAKVDIAERVKDISLNFATDYYLRSADENTRTACKAIINSAQAGERSTDLDGLGLTEASLSDLVTLIVSCTPELASVNNEFSYTVGLDGKIKTCTLDLTYGKTQQEQMTSELITAADIIVGAAAELDDLSKLCSFHDALVRKCVYTDKAESPYTAYGCLVEGEAVCEGYSKAFLLLCQRAGIDCIPVFGITNEDGGTPHMWNKVRLDGEWYNVDVTWDDPVSNIGADFVRHDYLCVTDSKILIDHTFEDNDLMKYPAAEGEKYNFFRYSGLYIDDVSKADDILLAAIGQKVFLGEKYVQIMCSDKDIYDSVYSREFEGDADGNTRIFDILASAAYAAGGAFRSDTYSVSKNDSALTLTVILSY